MRSVCRFFAVWAIAGLCLAPGEVEARPKAKSASKRITKKKPAVKARKRGAKPPAKKRSASGKRVTVKRKPATPVKRKTRWIKRKPTQRPAQSAPAGERRAASGGAKRRVQPKPAPPQSRPEPPVRPPSPAERDRANWRETNQRVRRIVQNGGASRGGASGRSSRGRLNVGAGRGAGPSAVSVGLPRGGPSEPQPGAWVAPPRISGTTAISARSAAPAPALVATEPANESVSLRPATAAAPLAPSAVTPTNIQRSGLDLRSKGEAPGWFDGLGLDASVSNWLYQPVSTKSAEGWRATSTTEVYDIDPTALWHLGLRLDTRWVRLRANYESDVGFDFTGRASLLNVMVALSGFDRVTFELRRLDFDHGRVRLERRSGGVIEAADFSTELTRGELRYTAESGFFAFGRAQLQGLPRNVYLKEATGDEALYFQVSDQLLHIETEQYMLGGGWTSTSPLDVGDPARDTGFSGGVHLGLGAGPYTIHTLAEHQYLDEGWLLSLSLGGEVAWRTWLNDHVSVGVRDRLTLNPLAPIGLPDAMKRGLRRDGVDTDGYALDFGTMDLLNELQLFVTIAL